jgi:hypothetical protein
MKLKCICYLIMMFTVLSYAGTSWAAQDKGKSAEPFLKTMTDIPLMKGMIEVENDSIVFDKPSGRIVESAAKTRELNKEDIMEFYSRALPQLGWQKTGEGCYIRDGEKLNISVIAGPQNSTVRFMVTPR